jgi:hypothetical protein
MTQTLEDSRIPHRFMSKQDAARHLLHAAIRMVMQMEDPFAIHVIVHSADKIIIDMAKNRGKHLRMDWELYIKDEFHKAFFKRLRETYNYLKHATEDADTELPVHDIMSSNVMALFCAVTNYVDLFGERTAHMLLFQTFVMNLMPDILVPSLQTAPLISTFEKLQAMTPHSFFKTLEEIPEMLPLPSERAEDIKDVIDYYHLSFQEIRAGIKSSSSLI